MSSGTFNINGIALVLGNDIKILRGGMTDAINLGRFRGKPVNELEGLVNGEKYRRKIYFVNQPKRSNSCLNRVSALNVWYFLHRRGLAPWVIYACGEFAPLEMNFVVATRFLASPEFLCPSHSHKLGFSITNGDKRIAYNTLD